MPTRRTVRHRNPSSFIGERIRDAIRFMREEAHDLRKKADDIENAWGQHDYAYLRDVGVITATQYADIMAEAAPHTNRRRNSMGADAMYYALQKKRIPWGQMTRAQIEAVVQDAAQHGDADLVRRARAALARRHR
jgi:hypothetical protein